MTETDLHTLAGRFRRFADRECIPASPLYEVLSHAVSEDAELLALAAEAPPAQPAPNLLFAAVHFLLRRDPADPLAAFYPDLSPDPKPPAEAVAAFRAFCRHRAEELLPLLRTRSVGTNEVARCACLFPAFLKVLETASDRPVHFLEIGASAGLNMLWPSYGYDYGDGHAAPGVEGAPVIACALRGDPPPVTLDRGRLGRIAGVDLQPLNLADRDDADWLRALVWPEQRQRRERLDRAIDFARRNGVRVQGGDGIAAVLALAADLPEGDAFCVVHSFTMNQVPEAMRRQLDDHLIAVAAERPVFRVGMEWERAAVTVTLTVYDPQPRSIVLAEADAHGGWLDWRDGSS